MSHPRDTALIAAAALIATITALSAQPSDPTSYGRRLYHDKAQCSYCHGWAADGAGEPQSNGGAANIRQSFLNRDQLIEVIMCGGRERRCPITTTSPIRISAAMA